MWSTLKMCGPPVGSNPMKVKKFKTLSAGHRRALGLREEAESTSAVESEATRRYYSRHQNLAGIPGHIIRKAWFTTAHLLLPPGSQVADMGCEDGAMTYAMAALNPHIDFIGVDMDKKTIARARDAYSLPNLSFQTADISKGAGFEKGSLDGIINSFILHEVYSNSRYDDRHVVRTLESQFDLLRQEGLMFIRDYALHHGGEYVLMEMPDTANHSTEPEKMSETELLIWYAEKARPREDPGCHGFFLEELPARFPKTRLFRLPYKWAYEFIIRKDDRARFKAEMHKEYAFFTEREFGRSLRPLGARALYTAPHWDDMLISKRFDGHFRLFDENGQPLGAPPTSFLVIAQKMGERKSLNLQERRTSQKSQAQNKLRVAAMRNDRTGRLIDIVSRDSDITEIIPYRVTEDGHLNVFIHESLPRGIVNAIPRTGRDLDGKRWSGHMVEALAIPTDIIHTVENSEPKETVKFARDYLGLKPAIESFMEQGSSYYPAPDSIDEMIKTRYLRIVERNGPIVPKSVMEDITGFTSTGQLREVSAQHILNAISVGFIPNARLELQILALFEKLGLEAEAWDECPLVLEESDPEDLFDPQSFMKLRAEKDDRFKKVRGTAGQLRTMQSIFVDEGWVNGGVSGLASRDMEFVIPDDNTLNKAVILPLTKKSGDVMIGFEVEYMPIPQRHEGNGLTLRAPSINLPKEVTNIHQAKEYVANLFNVPQENVWRLGEPYFCHAGVTPQRIFPFAVATKGKKERPISGPIQYAPMKYMWKVIGRILDWKFDQDFLSKMTKAYRRLGDGSDLHLKPAEGVDMMRRPDVPAILHSSTIAGLDTASPPPAQTSLAAVSIVANAEASADSAGTAAVETAKRPYIK